jgi:DNA-binding transcriptional LysR family regulator
MELKHLRYFVTAVEEGSLQAAAEKLAIAQPALSRRIQDLEADLGCALLVRSVRGVAPTLAGQALYRDSLQILDLVTEAAQLTRRVGLDQGRQTRLGVIRSARKYEFIQQALAAHSAKQPNAGVAITRDSSWKLAGELREGRLDATLLYERLMNPARFSNRLVHRERYILAMHPSHRLATPGVIELGELSAEPFVWMPRRQGVDSHDPLLQHCRLKGLEPVVRQLANSPEELVDVVAVLGGLCLTPASTALTTPPGQLFFRAVPALSVELDLTLAWSRGLETAPEGAILADLHEAIDRHQAAIEAGAVAWAKLDGIALVRTT